jgi:hypothetical protein
VNAILTWCLSLHNLQGILLVGVRNGTALFCSSWKTGITVIAIGDEERAADRAYRVASAARIGLR